MTPRRIWRSGSDRTRCPGPTTRDSIRQLLADGDRRNVVDRYRYWTVEAIVADLDRRRHAFAVAIENWQHDMNIGTVVRTANAFLAAEVVIVGRRRWNRRGAMVTDRYQHLRHVDSPAELATYAGAGRLHRRRDRQPARRGPDRIDHACPSAHCCCSARSRSALRPRPATLRRWSVRSASSARPARSTPGWRRASRCTPGSASTRSTVTTRLAVARYDISCCRK